MTQNRQPRGVPVGGEFSEHDRGEADVSLHLETIEADDEYAPPTSATFPSSRLPEAIHRIKLANGRLKRAGLTDRFTYETDTSIKLNPITGIGTEMTTLTLNKPMLGYEGWTFVGAHDFTPDGNAIAAYRKDTEVPEPVDAHCDQCDATRNRERIYTLRDEGGETKQVGTSCLAVFLGIKPSGLWALEYELEAGQDYDPDSDEFRQSSSGSQVYPAITLVSVALAASDDGKEFVSKSAAGLNQKPTVVTVLDEFAVLREKLTDKNAKDARKIIRWVKSQPDDGDYISNLKAALVSSGGEEKWVKTKHAALAVSAIGSYRRAMERELERDIRETRKAKELKAYLAAPKEKIQDVAATVQLVRHFETNYGYYPSASTMVVMIADSGHILKWTASSYQEFEEGARVNVSATVKENEIYKDSWQTVLTRAKLTVGSHARLNFAG